MRNVAEKGVFEQSQEQTAAEKNRSCWRHNHPSVQIHAELGKRSRFWHRPCALWEECKKQAIRLIS